MLEKIGDMQQANDFNSGPDLFLAFPVERLRKRLSQVLGAAGQSEPFTLPSSLLPQKEDLCIANDNGSRRISDSWNQILHT
jgi:hypothetical protein